MEKIMIVDDDITNLAIAKAILEPDYEIVTAQSGVQALGYLEKGSLPALILMDVIMPGLSGIDVLKVLKRTPHLNEIPVLFLSGMEGIDVELEGFKNGAEDFLEKPLNAELLKIKIAHYLRIQRLKQENQRLFSRLVRIKAQLISIVG
ncbi:MAG: response regulator [Anaerotruncus sp.]|jgi:CheY-like chemotaxis protein|nr:response regulator [Anaerotruncus sp.]